MRKAAACFTTTSCVTGSALFQALLTRILAGLWSSLVKSVAQARQKSFNVQYGVWWPMRNQPGFTVIPCMKTCPRFPCLAQLFAISTGKWVSEYILGGGGNSKWGLEIPWDGVKEA